MVLSGGVSSDYWRYRELFYLKSQERNKKRDPIQTVTFSQIERTLLKNTTKGTVG